MPTLASDLDFEHPLGARRREVLAHADRIERMRVLILADRALQVVGDLPAALQRGHQAALQRQFRGVAVDRGQSRGLLRMYSLSALAGMERARVTSWL